MSIQKIIRKSGVRYKVRIRDENGNQISKTFKRKYDAEQWERGRLQKRDLPEIGTQACLEMPFPELVELWLVNHVLPRIEPSTRTRYEQFLRDYILPKFKERTLGKITTVFIEKWFVWVHQNPANGRKLAPKTLNLILNCLRTILNYAVDRNFIHYNPCNPIKNLPIPEQAFDFWAADEIQTFLNATKNDTHYGVYLMALNTGMRLGEIVGLRWECVCLKEGRITVRYSWSHHEKRLKETKTKKIRHLPIGHALHQFLIAQKMKSRSPWVFEDANGERIHSSHFGYRIFDKACARALVRRIRVHDLRHTYASHFVMNGGDIYVLQKLLGHSTIQMTERYSHLSPAHLARARNVVSFEAVENEKVLEFLPQMSNKINS